MLRASRGSRRAVARRGLVLWQWSASAPSMMRSNHSRCTPIARQPGGQAQALVHRADGVGHARSPLGQAHRLRHALQAALLAHRLGAGIEADHRRQEHRVQRAVVQLRVDAAQRMAQRMHAAQPLLEGQRALRRGAHHLQPRVAVAAVARGALDVRPAARQAVERDAVGRRVEGRRHEGFHAVRDRVHAGGRGQQRRQAERELGVADRGLGHQVPGMEAELAPVVEDDDRAARHLAAGAGGGGHGDQRHAGVGDLRRCRLRWWRRSSAARGGARRWPRPWRSRSTSRRRRRSGRRSPAAGTARRPRAPPPRWGCGGVPS